MNYVLQGPSVLYRFHDHFQWNKNFKNSKLKIHIKSKRPESEKKYPSQHCNNIANCLVI